MTCPVETQLLAYNARDIASFCEAFADDVLVFNYPEQEILRGNAELYDHYAAYFQAHPDLHCELVRRIRCGNIVIDEEKVCRVKGRARVHATAIYTVDNALIKEVRFIRGGDCD